MKRLVKVFSVFIIVLTVSMCTNCFAFSGWNYVNGEFVYLNNEGKPYCNVWRESNGEIYYLGSDGYIVKNRMFEYSGELYYVNLYGCQIRNSFIHINDESNTNEEFEEGYYYFDDKGYAVRKRGNKFIKNIEGVYYAFDENGKLLCGWLDKDGNVVDEENILTDGLYYANGDGVLMRNSWYAFSDDVGAYKTDIEKGENATELYSDMDCLWMYFDKNCKKIMPSDKELLLKTMNGKSYAFDEHGIMLQGFTINGELDQSQASNPKLNEKVKLFDKINGDQQKSAWAKTVPSSYMSSVDKSDNVDSWFRFDESGSIVKNMVKRVDGTQYAFDGIGRMVTGFVQMSEGEYIAKFKPEDLTKEDFMYHISEGGKLFGSDLCDLYYFGNELEEGGDGSMARGEKEIELRDGTYQFKFKKTTGAAYGMHTTLQKSGESYYINGLKLCAWDDERYGIVKVSDTEYRVVNEKGKVIKGNRKLIKDDYDNYMIIFGGRLVAYIENPGDSIKIRWRSEKKGVEAGYYFYNKDTDIKDYVGVAALNGTPYPSSDELADIPKEMRVNFK